MFFIEEISTLMRLKISLFRLLICVLCERWVGENIILDLVEVSTEVKCSANAESVK